MKGTLFVLLALGPGLPAIAQQLRRLAGEHYGFRDVQLGSDTSALAGRVLESRFRATAYYRRPGENLRIGGATAKTIRYYYYKGKLSIILVTTEGNANANALRAALENEYGWGKPETPYPHNYFWHTRRVKRAFKLRPDNETGDLLIMSREINDQMARDDMAGPGKSKR